jgi:hypothetical protein
VAEEQVMGIFTSPGHDAAAGERFLTVAEIAAMWGLSTASVRRIFLQEPGVLVIGRRNDQARIHKRVYRTLRIPESVVARVRQRLANGCT